jgi:hypothetical protein
MVKSGRELRFLTSCSCMQHKMPYTFRLWPVRLVVRTPGSHPGNRGSIPLRATIRLAPLALAHGLRTSGAPATPLNLCKKNYIVLPISLRALRTRRIEEIHLPHLFSLFYNISLHLLSPLRRILVRPFEDLC